MQTIQHHKNYRNSGLTFKSLIQDKKKRLHCPICGCLVQFTDLSEKNEPYIFESGYKLERNDTHFHSWECMNCKSFNEHSHDEAGFSNYGYDYSAIECYRQEAK